MRTHTHIVYELPCSFKDSLQRVFTSLPVISNQLKWGWSFQMHTGTHKHTHTHACAQTNAPRRPLWGHLDFVSVEFQEHKRSYLCIKVCFCLHGFHARRIQDAIESAHTYRQLHTHTQIHRHTHTTSVQEQRNQVSVSWLSHAVLLYARGSLSAPEQRRGDVSREQYEAEQYVVWVHDEQLHLQMPLLYKLWKGKLPVFCPPSSPPTHTPPPPPPPPLLPSHFPSNFLWICNLKLPQRCTDSRRTCLCFWIIQLWIQLRIGEGWKLKYKG